MKILLYVGSVLHVSAYGTRNLKIRMLQLIYFSSSLFEWKLTVTIGFFLFSDIVRNSFDLLELNLNLGIYFLVIFDGSLMKL